MQILCQKYAFFCKKIWWSDKKVVSLHAEKIEARILTVLFCKK